MAESVHVDPSTVKMLDVRQFADRAARDGQALLDGMHSKNMDEETLAEVVDFIQLVRSFDRDLVARHGQIDEAVREAPVNAADMDMYGGD